MQKRQESIGWLLVIAHRIHGTGVFLGKKYNDRMSLVWPVVIPIESMYGIFTYIYHKNQPNVGKYTYHTWMVWDCLIYLIECNPRTSYRWDTRSPRPRIHQSRIFVTRSELRNIKVELVPGTKTIQKGIKSKRIQKVFFSCFSGFSKTHDKPCSVTNTSHTPCHFPSRSAAVRRWWYLSSV